MLNWFCMNITDFAYITQTTKSFDEAVVALLKAVEQKGWSLFQIYDVKERLAAKGFQQKPLKIIEICSGKYANAFLNRNRFVSLCMPCKINVFEDNGTVKIAGMKPSIISQFFPEITSAETLSAEEELQEIIDAAK